MGYCSPDWISDYTYDAIFDRIAYVNSNAASAKTVQHLPPSSTFRRVLVAADGALKWGSSYTPHQAPLGEARAVSLLAPSGAAIASTTGYFRPFGDGGGGFLIVPAAALDTSAGVAAIRVGAAELSLSAPMP
jgi:hypothetical protein